MPIYTKRTMNKKYTKKQILGICFSILFSLLLVNFLFNIVTQINHFFLGFLGLNYVLVLITMIVIGMMMVLEKKGRKEYKIEVGIGIAIFMLILALLHLATVSSIPFDGFLNTMKAIYDYQYSMGGILFSTILYPLIAFTHKIATMVFLFIPTIILVAILVYRIYLRLTGSLGVIKKTQEKAIMPEKLVQQEIQSFEQEKEETQKEKSQKIDDTIFISDESLEKETEIANEKNHAKEILGLTPKQANLQQDTSQVEQLKIDTLEESEGKRPKKIVHKGDIWHDDLPNSYTKNKVLSENDRKNLAFLRSIQGKSMQDLKEQEKQLDIYDDHVTKNNYKNFVKPKFENPEIKYDAFHQNDFKIDQDAQSLKPSNTFGQQDPEKWSFPAGNKEDNTTSNTTENNYKVSNVLGGYNQMFFNGTKDKQTQKNEEKTSKSDLDFTKKPVAEVQKSKPKKPYHYVAPPIDLLNKVESSPDDYSEDFEEKANMLEQTLASFDINAKVVSITHGPAFSRFELQMPPGVPVRRVSGFVDDMAMALESHGNIRMEIPIKGRNTFGVEVPNKKIEKVPLRDIIDSEQFRSIKSPTAFALGKDITGEPQVTRIDKLKHVLIAGSTGSGKSVCMNSLLLSILYKASPEDVRLIIIDPKRVEFTPYNGIPHLLIPNVICEVDKAVMALNWAIGEMERRFQLFSKEFVRDLGEYNQTEGVRSGVNQKLPYILIIVDELADLMLQNKKEIEESLNRLLAKSRAAGIHLILATQRPSVDVITGTLKNNLPAKIAFKVSSMPDSKTIIGTGGAEKLLGRGDMLFVPEDNPDGHRIQGALVENSEIGAVVNFVKEHNEADFDEAIEEAMFNKNAASGTAGPRETEYDPLFKDACRNTIIANSISISKIQRLFGIGYPRAAKIVDQMIAAGFISDRDSNNKYTIFITQQEFEEKFGEDL